jgi:hypothetical protein
VAWFDALGNRHTRNYRGISEGNLVTDCGFAVSFGSLRAGAGNAGPKTEKYSAEEISADYVNYADSD